MRKKELDTVTSRNESISREIEVLTKDSQDLDAGLKVLRKEDDCEEEDKLEQNISTAR